MNNSVKNRLLAFWKGWGVPILTALLIATSFESAIANWYVVPTGSMKPTIIEGDRVFVNKLAYDLKIPYTRWRLAEWGAPLRGDIVVLYSPEDGMRLIKRIIGLPGDTIELKDNRLLINGDKVAYGPYEGEGPEDGMSQYLLTEDLVARRHAVMFDPDLTGCPSYGPKTVPEGSYFVMGDNRDNSKDSRYIGFIPKDRVVGRALSVVISLDINNWYKPRWERFFTTLQ
jgi:signal peptidase I